MDERPMAHDRLLLYVDNLKVYFQSNGSRARAVDGISFKVREKETVCIVGESGCGKTVSALSILGLIPIPPGEIVDGQIVFSGQNLLELNEKEMQKIRGNHISMVFQEPLTSLNPVLTIGDQIGEAVLTHRNIDTQALFQYCVQLLEDVGIPSPKQRMNDYPHQLSGGQRQRVMIAMALACDPDLIIADEPTTALDVTVQAQIILLLRSIQKKRSMSVLYISHDLGVVSAIANRVYVMYAGVIVEQGYTDQIFRTARHPYTQGLLASLPSLYENGVKDFTVSQAACRIRRINPRGVRFIRGVPMPFYPVGKNSPKCVITARGIRPAARYCLNLKGTRGRTRHTGQIKIQGIK